MSNGVEFAKPDAPRDSSNIYYDYYEQDEILKLRQLMLRKEDSDLQMEFEKLERERNLHIRELKRIAAEDASRFNNHVILGDRYMILTLLGKGGFCEYYCYNCFIDYSYFMLYLYKYLIIHFLPINSRGSQSFRPQRAAIRCL